MCFLSYLVLLIKILLSCVAPLRSPSKTAYLRFVFNQCHQILTKLSFKAPPRTALPVGVYRTGASKCTSAFSCFILFCPLFVQVGVISVWWFYHFHSAIFIIFCYLRYFCREQRLFLFRGVFPLPCFLFPNIYGTSVATDSQNRF